MSDGQDARSKQQEVQEYMYRLEIIRSQLDGLSQQGEIFELTTSEIMRAKETLESISTLESGKEILIPIGGDTFVTAGVADVKKILISVGANTVLEKDTQVAIEMLQKRLENLVQMNQNVVQGINNLQQQASELNLKIQELSKEIPG